MVKGRGDDHEKDEEVVLVKHGDTEAYVSIQENEERVWDTKDMSL